MQDWERPNSPCYGSLLVGFRAGEILIPPRAGVLKRLDMGEHGN